MEYTHHNEHAIWGWQLWSWELPGENTTLHYHDWVLDKLAKRAAYEAKKAAETLQQAQAQ